MSQVIKFPLLVLVISLVVLWLAVRIGAALRKGRRSLEEHEREDYGLIMAAILTLLGLIIGFSFSMAITRYDQRKNLEEEEAERYRHGIRAGGLAAGRGCGQSARVAVEISGSAYFVL